MARKHVLVSFSMSKCLLKLQAIYSGAIPGYQSWWLEIKCQVICWGVKGKIQICIQFGASVFFFLRVKQIMPRSEKQSLYSNWKHMKKGSLLLLDKHREQNLPFLVSTHVHLGKTTLSLGWVLHIQHVRLVLQRRAWQRQGTFPRCFVSVLKYPHCLQPLA